KPADLTLEQVRAIAEQFPRLERVVLHGIGEPLLNAEIFAIVAYLKSRAVTVLFNSDAISLTAGRALRLIESGLDEYRVSLDAATRQTYRRLRGVDQFDRVLANVRRLVELEREQRRSAPRVSLWFTASRANLHELLAFVRLAADLGVHEVYVQRLVFNGLGLATAENALHGRLQRQEQELLDQAEGLAHELGLALSASGLTTPLTSLQGGAPSQRPWAGCKRPWTLGYVIANPAFGWYAAFLQHVVVPHLSLFGLQTFVIELALGVALFFGIFTRLAGGGGFLWQVNIALGAFNVPGEWYWIWPLLTLPLFCFAFAGAGRIVGIDCALEPALRRRAMAGETWARVLQHAA